MSARFNNPFIQPKIIYRFTEKFRKEREARQFLFDFQKELFEKRKIEIVSGEICSEADQTFGGFIDKLITNENGLSESSIKDNILLLLLAGFESKN